MSGSMNHLKLPASGNLAGVTLPEKGKFVAIKAVSNICVSKRE
jgi:hypothetical protein